MKCSRGWKNFVVIVALGVFLPLGSLFATPSTDDEKSTPVPKGPDLSEEQLIGFFAAISNRLKEDYVGEVTNRELLEGALSGMISSLDPHSMYLSPEKFKELKEQTEGKFGGLGIEVVVEDSGVRIIAPIEDTPAAKAGIRPKDLIVAIDNVPVASLSPIDAIKKLRGTPGSKVLVTIQRDKKHVFDLTVVREIIEVKPVKSRIEGTIGYLRLTTFNEKSTVDLVKAIRDIQNKLGNKLTGYVIDVRNNAGGLLDQAVSVTSLFVGKDKLIVSMKGKDKKDLAEFKSSGSDITQGRPIVVLVNEGSASASEIFAGALQDYKRAIIVGTPSFGKGSVQRITPIREVGALKLTIALYYTPKGRSIQQEGIKPDILVEQHLDLKTINANKSLRELYLKHSLKKDGQGGSDPAASPASQSIKEENSQEQEKAKETSTEEEDSINFKDLPDYQLEQAFNILRAINFELEASKK